LAGYFVRRGLPFVIRKIATRKKRNPQITPPLKNVKSCLPICLIGKSYSFTRIFSFAKGFAIFRRKAQGGRGYNSIAVLFGGHGTWQL
jgi:hypothetical protein